MFLLNAQRAQAPKPRAGLLAALGRQGRQQVQAYLAACGAYRPTPLVSRPVLARSLGIGQLHVKDEGHRLGLKSFKALGGAYAVMRLVLEKASQVLGRTVEPAELQSEAVRDIAGAMVFACATDGNHGRSVAAGARLAGARSVIFMHERVSEERAAAIAAFGAEIRRVPGTYDDTVVEAARQASLHGWAVVSDTAYAGYEEVPLLVMQGYTVLAGEMFDQLAEAPTHIFVQAGVGGLAGAVAAHAFAVYGAACPKIVVAEPERAACLYASAVAGRWTAIPAGEPTIMGMLECYEPSPLGWEILHALADGFVAVAEDVAVEAMRRLGRPEGGDEAIVAGESGAASFAGLLTCLADPSARPGLGLGAQSRVAVINSEGATDRALYKQLTGVEP